MCCPHRTITTAICALCVLAACWVTGDLPLISNVGAQSGSAESPRTMTKGQLFTERGRARIEAILSEPVPEVKIFQMPLREVVVDLSEQTGISIFFDPEELGDVIDPDIPIDVQLAEGSVTFETLFKFMLEPNDLMFAIHDNYLVIMSYDKWITTPEATQIVVYNCRDLIDPLRRTERTVSGGREGSAESFVQFGGGGAGGFGSRSGEEQEAKLPSPDERVMLVIANTVAPGSWLVDGELVGNSVFDSHDVYGTINATNGLIVIRHTRDVHKEVRKLLQLLRDANRTGNVPATPVPVIDPPEEGASTS